MFFLWRWVKLALLLLAAAVLAATAFFFVWPSQDRPTRADAVVVLAGAPRERLAKGLRLMRRHVASVLVISIDPSSEAAAERRLCTRHPDFHVVCFRARPYSTSGEASSVAVLARERRWSRVVVVTSTYHVTRARMLFRRCYHRKLEVVGARPVDAANWAHNIFWEWPKLIYESTLVRGC